MFDVLFQKASDLNAQGQPFALAIVVRHETPISGKPGDKAIILADGSIQGWIGGGCTQPVIISEARKALADGRPRLVRVTPSSDHTEEGIVEHTMTCHSGGTLDIYIEPVLPRPNLVILGKSVVAQTLARLGKVLNYRIIAVAPDAGPEHFPDADVVEPTFDVSSLPFTQQTFIVVSTQGEGDEEALTAALKVDVPYVAFVASQNKAKALFKELQEVGIAKEDLARIRTPAGFNIQAHLPEEIAVSILAEIIYVMRSTTSVAVVENEAAPADEAIDPICGMTVDIATAKHTATHEGETYYFCCPACKRSFEKEPEQYVAAENVA